jgi:hypothetical protein
MPDKERPVTDAKGVETTTAEADDASPATSSKRRPSGRAIKAGADAVRSRIASVVWLAAVVCALFRAVGALLVALDANQKNQVVQFILDGADLLDGPFSRDNGVFTFDGKDAAVKSALVNWGIAAVVYLVIGKILDRVVRP